jgi:SAM-dependent methyltransferase
VEPVRNRWQGPGAGARYAAARWASTRRAERDPRLVAALLARHLPPGDEHRLLDAPCGTGRLQATLARHGRYVGVDVAPAMLAEARRAHPERVWLRGDVTRLPFPDGTFDLVLCCRLLHHFSERSELERVLAELVRVSRGLVIASFWDKGSLPSWRRAILPARRPARRHARSRGEIAALLAQAGAEVLGWKHSLRFVSRQAFVVARRRRA